MDVVYDAILGASSLKQIRRTSYRSQAKILTGRMSGAVDPSAKFLQEAQPRATFDCEDLAGLLTLISVTAGLYVSGSTVTLPWNKRANGGTWAGGSANDVLSGTSCLAVITSISGAQGDDGVVGSIELAFLSTDGQTPPIAASVNNALASQAYNAWYAMGPFYVDSSQLSQVKSTRVDPGVEMMAKMYDGDVYPRLTFIQARNPAVEVEFENFDALYAQTPIAAAMTNCAVYYRKRVVGGTFVSDATAAHVKLSLGTGIKICNTAEGSGHENATASLRFEGLLLSSSTASPIP